MPEAHDPTATEKVIARIGHHARLFLREVARFFFKIARMFAARVGRFFCSRAVGKHAVTGAVVVSWLGSISSMFWATAAMSYYEAAGSRVELANMHATLAEISARSARDSLEFIEEKTDE